MPWALAMLSDVANRVRLEKPALARPCDERTHDGATMVPRRGREVGALRGARDEAPTVLDVEGGNADLAELAGEAVDMRQERSSGPALVASFPGPRLREAEAGRRAFVLVGEPRRDGLVDRLANLPLRLGLARPLPVGLRIVLPECLAAIVPGLSERQARERAEHVASLPPG